MVIVCFFVLGYYEPAYLSRIVVIEVSFKLC